MKEIFQLIPYSLKEKIKLLYYNSKQPDYKFELQKDIYVTTTKSWSIRTHTPLYFLTREIERYERFYRIQEYDTVIDAGAFNGILSLIYSNKAKLGKVFSFEPDVRNIESLNKNFALNYYPDNIQLIKMGLWSQSGKIKFFEDGSVASSSFYKAKNSLEKNIRVIALDDFAYNNNLKKINFIKMDVEGAELDILKGATRMLIDYKPNLSIATYHFVNNELTYKSVEEFFRDINYPFKTIFYEDGEIITYAGPQVK